MTTETQRLALIGNNAYTTIALMDGDTVIGDWPAADPEIWAEYLRDRGDPAAVADWEPTYPEHTRISDYGAELDAEGIREREDFYGQGE